MDSCTARALSGRQTSTSLSLGRRTTVFATPDCMGRIGSASVQRSSRSVCRSVFDSSDGSRGSPVFPTVNLTGQDWRAFRAHLVAWERSARHAKVQSSDLKRPPYPPLVSGNSWAHPLAEPEPGCLLLAKRDNMMFFTDAVVLITSHDDAVGSVGFVLNKPSPMKVDDMQIIGCTSGFKEAFGSQNLLVGGPMHPTHITLLHRFMGISRHRIADGMHMGGLPDAVRMVKAGLLRASDFTLVLGMSTWGPGQLQEEIAGGWWHVISASPDLVLPTASPPPVTTTTTSACAQSMPSSRTLQQLPPDQQQPQHPSQEDEDGEDGLHRTHQQQHSSPQAADGSCGTSGRGAGRGPAARRVQSPMYKRIARLAVRGA